MSAPAGVVAACSGLCVLVAAWRFRPAPARTRALVASRSDHVRRKCATPVRQIGAAVRRCGGRPTDPALDERAGRLLVAAAVGGVVHPVLGVVTAAVVWGAGVWRTRQGVERDRRAVVDTTPDVIDLFGLAVDAGLSPRSAVEEIATRVQGRWNDGLERAVERVRRGSRLADALESVPETVGDPARPLVAALVDAERYGTPLAPALDRLALVAAEDRRRRGEERARRVPVQLLFPLVACTLPAFVLLTVVPLLAGSLSSISL